MRYAEIERSPPLDKTIETPPAIIKLPFWRMAQKNRDATYVQLNLGEVIAPKTLEGRIILVDGDAAKMIAALKEKLA